MTPFSPSPSAAGGRPWLLALLLAVIPLWNHPYFEELKSPNPLSRSYLARALWDHGTVRIDEVEREFGDVMDRARRDGHDYCDKAPGSSFLLVPVYAVLRIGHAPRDVSHARLLGFGSVFLGALPAFLALLAIDALLVMLGVRRASRRVALVGMGLGSVGVPFELLFFGHELAGCFVAFSLWSGLRAARTGRFRDAVLAGFLAGWAIITEYPAALLVGAIVLLGTGMVLASGRGALERLAVMAAGVLVGVALPAALAMAYHSAAFGGPLTTGYAFIDNPFFASIHRKGLMGVSLPTLQGLAGTLFSPARGLFYFQPYLLAAPVGCWALWRSGQRGLAGTLVLALTAYICFAAGFGFWQGGWSLGPRHLVPSLPLWTVAFAAALNLVEQRAAWLGAVLRGAVAWSVVVVGLAAVTHSGYPEEFVHPYFQMTLPLFSGGFFPYSLATLLGWDRAAGAVVTVGCVVVAVGVTLLAGRSLRWRDGDAVLAALSAWSAVVIIVVLHAPVTYPPEASHRLAWIMDTVWEPRRPAERKRPDPVKLAPAFSSRAATQDERNHVGRHHARTGDPQRALELYVQGVADGQAGRK